MCHGDAGGQNYKAEELSCINGKLTFLSLGIELVFPEAGEDFADVGLVLVGVLGEDEDVVQVYNHEFVKDIGENAVHEALKGGGSVGETEVHDQEIEGAVAGAEGSLPFVARSNSNKVVSTTEVNLCKHCGAAKAIEKVRNEREWIPIFLCHRIEAVPIDTQVERSILHQETIIY